MSTITRRVRRLAATGAAALAISGFAGLAPAHAAQTTNQDPTFLVVYDNNLENMLPTSCEDNPNDFDKLFAYLKAQPKSPDVFTVQQISDQTKLNAFTKRMTDELPGVYKGVIAVASPNPDGSSARCSKDHQTNAVIYRSDRLTAGTSIRWRSDSPGDKETSTGPCANFTESRFQDRVENLAVRLTDTVAKKDVVVASFHWPTKGSSNGPLCADENIKEAKDRTAEIGSGVFTVLGGDANARVVQGRTAPWGERARGYGFKDPYDFRDSAPCAVAPCAPGTFTDGRRIDFLLAKGGSGFANVVTISQAAAGGRYSDHLAVRADVRY